MNFIRNRKFRAGPQTSLEGFICPQNSDKQQKIKVFGRSGGVSSLVIKYNAGIRGVEFNLNGANIEVGELCMFSYGITLRNHDSHRIINPIDGSVINSPKDIVLGKHVWVAQNATILKGCHIGDNSVIGFGAIVTKSCDSGSIMTGVPAKVVKENINWDY